MLKFKWFLLLLVIGIIDFSFVKPPREQINWITVQQLNELYYKNPRPILVDIYTEWCGWCKQMDRTTYTNAKLAKYVNEKFYAVKYNAESADTVVFNKKQFAYNATMQTNDLALYLTSGRREYPHTIFLSAIDAQPAPLSGYMKPNEMEAPMKFFGEHADASQTFVEFNKSMKKDW